MSIHPLLAARRSSRLFDPIAAIPADVVEALVDAARSAPSAYNFQPWRLLLAVRGTREYAAIAESLADYNAIWARDASMFVIGVTESEEPDGTPHPWALYDLGQATASLALEASSRGLALCQMAGFDAEALRAVYDFGTTFEPRIITAVGRPAVVSEVVLHPGTALLVAGARRRKARGSVTGLDVGGGL